MNAVDAAVVFSDQQLVAGYEELRFQALEGCYRGPGLAIMMTRGFRCWMECCTRLLSAPSSRTGAYERTEPPIPADFRGEVIVLVASMLLHRALRGIA